MGRRLASVKASGHYEAKMQTQLNGCKYNQMGKTLHIRLGSLEIRHQNGIEESYFSINYNGMFYFSSTFDHQNTRLQDDILIELEAANVPETLQLQRWEHCMIVFSFEIDIGELKSRPFAKKRVETRAQQFLLLDFQLYEDKEILFTDKYLDKVSQHYLIIEDLFFINEKNLARASKQPNYFTITSKHSTFMLPLRQAVVLVKLPDSVEIKSFINSNFNGRSGTLRHDKLSNGEEISIDKDMRSTGKIHLKIRWAINLHRYQIDQNLLMQSNELMLYDLELRFENPGDVVGCRLKVTHCSKAFEFSEEVDKAKVTKIKKVVFFIIKSEAEQINFVLTKGGKVFSYCRVNSSEISDTSLTILKRKWPDLMNPAKSYGQLKLRAERSRNLSVPHTNRHWREVMRRKHSLTNMMVSIHQPSVYFPSQERLSLVAKVDNEEKTIPALTNLNFYEDQDEPTKEVLEFAVKGEESLYLVVKSDTKGSDFAGIGVVNTTELRLGMNVMEVPFFKNQEKAGVLNCCINKIVFWPFLKPVYQGETSLQGEQNLTLDLFFNSICFTPYFYTYRYDGKQEVYCIVEVAKAKRVLILENTEHDPLNFFAAAGSDVLSYTADPSEAIKVKLTFLVSDLGHEEEIYGTAVCKVKGSELLKGPVKVKNIEILNDYSVVLGSFSLEASKGLSPKQSPKNKTADNEKPSMGSFDLSQASFETNLMPKSSNPSRRYSGSYSKSSSKPSTRQFLKKNTHPGKNYNDVKLPTIKQKKDRTDNFKDLLQLMKVRKRQLGGGFEEKGLSSPKYEPSPRQERHSFDLRRLEQSNPNLDRNLEILFPRKSNDKFIQATRSRKDDYQERLRGLKSVMNEMSDIGEVQPTIRESNEQQNEEVYEPEPEWQGNQFAAHP